jgi:hypothetical protein
VYVSISRDSDWGGVTQIVNEMLGQAEVYRDFGLLERFRKDESLPVTVVVDRAGKVRLECLHELTEADLRMIDEVVAQLAKEEPVLVAGAAGPGGAGAREHAKAPGKGAAPAAEVAGDVPPKPVKPKPAAKAGKPKQGKGGKAKSPGKPGRP